VWRLIADTSDGFLRRDVDLLSGLHDADDSVHFDSQWTPAAIRASTADVARVFLDFSRFPSLRTVLNPDGGATVRWIDIRFVLDNVNLERRAGFFSTTVDLGADGTIQDARLGR
jgi:hypothetical protein